MDYIIIISDGRNVVKKSTVRKKWKNATLGATAFQRERLNFLDNIG
jgi:hypothetical protein